MVSSAEQQLNLRSPFNKALAVALLLSLEAFFQSLVRPLLVGKVVQQSRVVFFVKMTRQEEVGSWCLRK